MCGEGKTGKTDDMKQKWLIIVTGLILLTGIAQAETVHLRSGEVIRGKITQVDAENISIESEQGFGVIEINRKEIALVIFDEGQRDMKEKMGIGYLHLVSPNTAGANFSEYAVDSFSFKFWLTSEFSLNFLMGFYNVSNGNTSNFEVFSYDLRAANVFRRSGSLDMYYGASVGIISVTDTSQEPLLDESGNRLRAFLGAEMFFPSLPNLGISSEVGFGSQSVGNTNITNISTTTFPTFSLHYYF